MLKVNCNDEKNFYQFSFGENVENVVIEVHLPCLFHPKDLYCEWVLPRYLLHRILKNFLVEYQKKSLKAHYEYQTQFDRILSFKSVEKINDGSWVIKYKVDFLYNFGLIEMELQNLDFNYYTSKNQKPYNSPLLTVDQLSSLMTNFPRDLVKMIFLYFSPQVISFRDISICVSVD